MWDKIKGWFDLQSLVGLEVKLGQQGVDLVHACALKVIGNKLSVKDQQPALKNITHFGKHFKPSPIALCLSGRGILVKSISSVPFVDQQIIQKILPDANIDDFYIQADQQNDHTSGANQTILYLIRKTVADAVIAELSQLGFQVLSLQLSTVSLGKLPESLRPELLPAYSAAFQVLVRSDYAEVMSKELAERKSQAFARSKVLGIAAVFGGILMVLLLLNFSLFTHYYTQANDLADRNTRSGQEVRKFQQMEASIVQKAALVKKAGWAGGYPLSWLTDQLAKTIPASIRISTLSINPLIAKTQSYAGEEVYDTGKIHILGTCDRAATLNNWLFEIRGKKWVKECIISAYEMNKETERGQFIIDIIIQDYEG